MIYDLNKLRIKHAFARVTVGVSSFARSYGFNPVNHNRACWHENDLNTKIKLLVDAKKPVQDDTPSRHP